MLIASPPARAGELSMKDCEQEDSSPLAIRACTIVLQTGDVPDGVRARIYTRRGHAWLIEEDAEEAIADFTRALEIDPLHVPALKGRARANSERNRHELAAGDWSKVIATDPAGAAGYLMRGESWLAAANTAASMADYDKVLELSPESVEAHIGRGKVYVALGEREKALVEFGKAEAIDPNNHTPVLARAEAAERWGDTKLAIESYSKVLNFRDTVWTARMALKRLGIDTPP